MDDQNLFFTKIFTGLIKNGEKTELDNENQEVKLKEKTFENEWEQEYQMIYNSYIID